MIYALLIILIIPAFILLYDIFIWFSLRHEEQGRLTRREVMTRLAPIQRQGGHDKPAILLLHGLGGSANDLRPLADAIPIEFTVHAPTLPGHGTSSPRNLAKTTWADWLGAAKDAASELRTEHEQLIICGFSMGGLLALEISSEIDVAATILINPYTKVPYRLHYVLPISIWSSLATPFVPYTRKIYSGRINDPDGRRRYEPSYWHVSSRAFRQLQKLSNHALNNLNPMAMPVYLHISQGDVVSDPRLVVKISDLLSLPDSHIHRWPLSNHVALYDVDHDLMIKEIIHEMNVYGVCDERDTKQ